MNQKGFIDKILGRFTMTDCKPKLATCEQWLELNCHNFTDARKYGVWIMF